jgi:hypothetical protein
MIHQMVARIKKRLKRNLQIETLGTLAPWVRGAFNNATTPEGFLDLLIALDRLIATRIGIELAHYNLDTPISGQVDRSAEIRAYAEALFEIYCIAAQEADNPRLLAVGGNDLRTVVQNMHKEFDKDDGDEAHLIVDTAYGLILLALLCAMRCNAGRRMVQSLAACGHAITIKLQGRLGDSSLVAGGVNGDAYCTAPKNQRGDVRLYDRLVRNRHKGQGTASVIFVPYCPSNVDGLDYSQIPRSEWFNPENKNVNVLLSEQLHGSLSFDDTRRPFYCPPRLEFTHELIHVLHNARGTNREFWGNQLIGNNTSDWRNAEEYWTITGGNINENVFNQATGLPRRFGHSGLPLYLLPATSEKATATLRQIAKNLA